MSKQPELIELELECLTITDGAFLVISDWNKNAWVPRSLVKRYNINEQTNPYTIKFTLPHWIAQKKGLI